MNHLDSIDCLANRFSVMRHAQSKANAAGIIVSRIENDRRGDHGLTEQGRRQALVAARGSGLPRDTIICSSDFSRARQTAEIVRAHLGAPEVVIAEALRERCFGQWEGSSTANYARVWAADEMDSRHADGDVEAAADVLDRATAFIAELERRHSGRDILLVSHGDTLQILQAGFLRADPSGHRSVPHLETAEIRRLDLRGSRLVSGSRSEPGGAGWSRLLKSGLHQDGGNLPVSEDGKFPPSSRRNSSRAVATPIRVASWSRSAVRRAISASNAAIRRRAIPVWLAQTPGPP
jgi:glucosyl-3-phosphoglycerate phosphatase